MRVVLIRHSKTAGNLKGRYIGTTDEPLCEEGIRLLEGKTYPAAELVYVSPMKRCRETASLIYPTLTQREEPLLRECDFGDFENKNVSGAQWKSGLSGLGGQRRNPAFSGRREPGGFSGTLPGGLFEDHERGPDEKKRDCRCGGPRWDADERSFSLCSAGKTFL